MNYLAHDMNAYHGKMNHSLMEVVDIVKVCTIWKKQSKNSYDKND